MAEAFLKKYGGDYFEVESAGLEPGKLNSNVVEVMQEIGIDISMNGTQSVFDLLNKARFIMQSLLFVTRRVPKDARFSRESKTVSLVFF